MRNHNTLKRDKLIPELAKCVPEGHTVSLDNPELFILVEIFKVCVLMPLPVPVGLTLSNKSVCGISVVKDYYKLQKFNVMEIANARNLREEHADGRVSDKTQEDSSTLATPAPEES